MGHVATLDLVFTVTVEFESCTGLSLCFTNARMFLIRINHMSQCLRCEEVSKTALFLRSTSFCTCSVRFCCVSSAFSFLFYFALYLCQFYFLVLYFQVIEISCR